MNRRWVDLATLGFTAAAFLCWAVMFLSGHDVWHDVGRPDIWNLPGPPYADLRTFAVAFYVMLVVFVIQIATTAAGFVTRRRGRDAI